MTNLGLLAGPVERMPAVDAWPLPRRPVRSRFGLSLLVHWSTVGKLNAVMGHDRMDLVSNGCDQILQKDRGIVLTGSRRRDEVCGTRLADLETSTLARVLLTAAGASIQ